MLGRTAEPQEVYHVLCVEGLRTFSKRAGWLAGWLQNGPACPGDERGQANYSAASFVVQRLFPTIAHRQKGLSTIWFSRVEATTTSFVRLVFSPLLCPGTLRCDWPLFRRCG